MSARSGRRASRNRSMKLSQIRILVVIALAGCGLLGCTGPDKKVITEKSNLVSQSNVEAYTSFAEASQLLKKRLTEAGYTTFEGDHGIGTAESFHVTSTVDSLPDLRVNTSWLQTEPLGSYTLSDGAAMDGDSVVALSRLDAKGAWINCGRFQFEILTTSQFKQAATLLMRIRQSLGC